MENKEKLILNVEAKSSEELIKHKKGPGTRYVFSDHENNPESGVYVSMRAIENEDHPELFIEAHSHEYENLIIFKGKNPDLSGLEVEVLLGDQWYNIQSPKAIRIPPGVNHNYRIIRGSGEFWNIILAPGGDYNKAIR